VLKVAKWKADMIIRHRRHIAEPLSLKGRLIWKRSSMVERRPEEAGVSGSSPFVSTNVEVEVRKM
jgi:hypothetical protein